MSVSTYAIGVAISGVICVSAAVIGFTLRAWLLPGRGAAPSRLAEVILAVGAVIAGGQALGVAGLFRADLLAAALAVVAVGFAAIAIRRPGTVTEPEPRPPPSGRATAAAAVLAVALLVGQWTPRVLTSLDRGMLGDDDLHYHMPFAARFATDESITAIHHGAPGGATQFLPANSELLHAVGISAFGRDILSPLLNMGWLAVALLAAWCIGRRQGTGAIAVAAVAAVLASPLLSQSQPGGAMNDVVEIALLLSACALVLHAGSDRRAVAVAAIAAGLGVGNKPSMLVPVAVLALVTLARRPRPRTAAVWVGGLGLGALWYLRNLVVVGNPFPSVSLELGPVRLRAPELELIELYGYTVAHYAADVDVWREVFLPGVRVAFGPAWVALAGVAVLGIWAAFRRGREERTLAAVAVAGLLAYTAIPGSAWGTEGRPVLFTQNLRWATSSLAVALAAVALGRWVQRPAGRVAVLALIGSGMAGAQLAGGVWPGWAADHRRAGLVVAALTALAGLLLVLRPGIRRLAAPVGVVALFAATVVGFPVGGRYLDRRYAEAGYQRGALYEWARDVRDARIAAVGFYQLYPLYGLDLSNHVQYLGRTDDLAGLHTIGRCAAWREAVDRGRFDYVVTAPLDFETRPPAQAEWTRSAPGASEILRTGHAAVFRVDGPLDGGGCDTAAAQLPRD